MAGNKNPKNTAMTGSFPDTPVPFAKPVDSHSASDEDHLLQDNPPTSPQQEEYSYPTRCNLVSSTVVGNLSFWLGFAGMVACSVCAAKVVSGEITVLPAGYGLLVTAAVLFAIAMVAVPLAIRKKVSASMFNSKSDFSASEAQVAEQVSPD